MGREALARVAAGAETGEARALLESQELILRGGVRRRFPRDEIAGVQVAGEALAFTCRGELVRLELGAAVAEVWAKVLLTPPPTLRAKLGLDRGHKALLLGPADDAALAEALQGVIADAPAAAAMVVARIDSAAALAEARHLAAGRPLWAVYAKGRDAPFGDGAVRAAMRAAGWRDTKTCAVSDRLSATRYHPPSAGSS